MYSKYYQNELAKLRGLAKEFSKAHPATAPMLSSESVDPDVERLLEGTAFLTGHLYHKIDDDFPEIVHGLMDMIYPHYLKPVPSVSIVAFSPKPALLETIEIPEGTLLAAKEKNNLKCRFKTCFDFDVHPLRLLSAQSRVTEDGLDITLSFELSGITLGQLATDALPFSLAGSYADTSNLFACFTRFLKGIKLVCRKHGTELRLDTNCLTPIGLDRANSLFSYPTQSFSGFPLLQEYFLFPQKFLFFKLSGLQRAKNLPDDSTFDIEFEFTRPPFDFPLVSTDNFSLFAIPVVNVFPMEAEPIVLDHTKEKVRIRPSLKTGDGHQIYSVDRVTGYRQGSVTPIDYLPMDNLLLDQSDPSDQSGWSGSFYKATRQFSSVTNQYEVFLSTSYAKGQADYRQETLTIDLTCTNGNQAEQLMPGDICEHTSNSPELLNFKNITSPTASVDPPLEGDTLWRLLSHISLNLLCLEDAKSLRELLSLYIFQQSRDKAMVTANLKRIDGISEFKTEQEDRLVRGMVIRGLKITLSISKEGFASLGDVVVFGAVLDEFFSRYSNLNSYTRLIVNETISGESFSWPPRIGDKILR